MLIEQAMEFCPYLGIEVGRINENGKTILTKRVGDSERLHTNEEFTKYITERLSQSEDVMGRVREWHTKYGATPCLKSLCSDNSYVGYGRFEKPETLIKQAFAGRMTLKDMGVE